MPLCTRLRDYLASSDSWPHLRFALYWFGLSRLCLLAVTLVSPLVPPIHASANLLTEWSRYDSAKYWWIAAHGYSNPYYALWLPLFPLLEHCLLWLPGGGYLAGLLVSNSATLAAVVGIALLQAAEMPPYPASRAEHSATVWFLAYPLAFFLTAPWAQSLLVAFGVWTFYALSRQRWLVAAVCVALACLAASLGLCLIVPYAWEIWRQVRTKRQTQCADAQPSHIPLPVMLAMVPTLLVILPAYETWQFHNPVLYITQESRYFNHHFTLPWTSLWLLTQQCISVTLHDTPDLPRLLVDALPWLLMTTLLIYATIRRLLPTAHLLYIAALLLLILVEPITGPYFPDMLVSAGRYLTAAIPIFLLLPRLAIGHPLVSQAVLWILVCLQAVLTLYYLLGGWLV